jgi:hypothetical protein
MQLCKRGAGKNGVGPVSNSPKCRSFGRWEIRNCPTATGIVRVRNWQAKRIGKVWHAFPLLIVILSYGDKTEVDQRSRS